MLNTETNPLPKPVVRHMLSKNTNKQRSAVVYRQRVVADRERYRFVIVEDQAGRH